MHIEFFSGIIMKCGDVCVCVHFFARIIMKCGEGVCT